MIKKLAAALVIAASSFVTAAQAGTITINDLGGAPTFTATSDFGVSSFVSAPGSLSINFTFHIPFGDGTIENATGADHQAFNLLDGAVLSDTLLLQATGNNRPGSTDWLEDFTLTFLSGSGLSPLAGGTDVPESLGVSLPINNKGVSGTSLNIIVNSVDAVPEPLTLSIFGAGLAGAVATRRRKKAA
jgi:hypothetical protein